MCMLDLHGTSATEVDKSAARRRRAGAIIDARACDVCMPAVHSML
jgi:hypothetical protein